VLFDQVADHRPGPRAVVGADDVGVRRVRRAGDQHDRDTRGKLLQLLRGLNALGYQQPVDLGGHLLQPVVGVPVVGGAAHRDQHRPAERAQRRLNAAEHLLDEQQARLLDLGVRAAGLDGDEPDHFLAPAGHALRRAVGDVAQGLDDLKHPLPGGRADAVLAVHHPGNGRRRHSSLASHVIKRAGEAGAGRRR
jgi:hypothetical protein